MTDAVTAPRPTRGVSMTTHATFWVSALAVVAFAAWASVSTLDIVANTSGEVIPSSQIKTVQHLEGGIVREIKVEEGQKVEVDQTLVILEPTVSGADVGELRVRLTALETDIAQLEALAAGAETPTFPEALLTRHPDLVNEARDRFQTRRQKHLDDINRQEQTVEQRHQQIAEIENRIKGNEESLRLVDEQIGMSQELLEKNLINRFKHLNLLREGSTLRTQVQNDRSQLSRAETAMAEAQAELAQIRSSFADDVQKSLEETRLRYRELTERVRKFEDSLERTVVRSPVQGIVKTLHVVTVGGVLGPGDKVAEIVPIDDRLIVEAKLKTQDIGYVAIGQQAVIRLASSDAVRFGNLVGNVAEVSPDTLIDDDGRPFYRVRVELPRDHFEKGGQRYALFPGMQVSASIMTGERTVMDYILDPLLYRMSNAFQER